MNLHTGILFCLLVVNVNSSPSASQTADIPVKTIPWPHSGFGSLNHLDLLRMQEMGKQASSSKIRGFLQTMFVNLAENFQELINRQQALIDMIYCKNCGVNPWQNFLNAMANIPTLGWVMRPQNSQHLPKPDGTFIAATNVDGVVNGVGGAIYNGDPIVEYTFNNNHVTPIRPQNAQAMAAGPISPLST